MMPAKISHLIGKTIYLTIGGINWRVKVLGVEEGLLFTEDDSGYYIFSLSKINQMMVTKEQKDGGAK